MAIFKTNYQMKNLYPYLTTLLALTLAVFFMCKYFSFPPEIRNADSYTEQTIRTDTLYIKDTIKFPEPFPVETKAIDTLLVPVSDTIRLRDTIFIRLPREQKHYEDSTYSAWISGYQPSLDSLQIYHQTKFITKEIIKTIPPKRFSVGLQAGYGIGIHQSQPIFTPYVGVGICVKLW